LCSIVPSGHSVQERTFCLEGVHERVFLTKNKKFSEEGNLSGKLEMSSGKVQIEIAPRRTKLHTPMFSRGLLLVTRQGHVGVQRDENGGALIVLPRLCCCRVAPWAIRRSIAPPRQNQAPGHRRLMSSLERPSVVCPTQTPTATGRNQSDLEGAPIPRVTRTIPT
jgi:hypothetical protein